uniref:Secreted protein n=1 Tax=Lygus hesperus TaxID=30085 RepID=A0A0K8SFI6_LYGHE
MVPFVLIRFVIVSTGVSVLDRAEDPPCEARGDTKRLTVRGRPWSGPDLLLLRGSDLYPVSEDVFRPLPLRPSAHSDAPLREQIAISRIRFPIFILSLMDKIPISYSVQ